MKYKQDAIQEYLAAVNDPTRNGDVREVEAASQPVAKLPGVNHQQAVRGPA